jgi:hypothetical protein
MVVLVDWRFRKVMLKVKNKMNNIRAPKPPLPREFQSCHEKAIPVGFTIQTD